MSRLCDVPGLPDLISKHGLEVFVETGYGNGDGIAYASKLGFSSLYSCDLKPPLRAIDNAEGAYLYFGYESAEFLRLVVPSLKSPTLFWLDAHFPEKFGAKGNSWPLPDELKAIAQKKWLDRDVIICDDIHCIQDPENPTREDGPGHDWEPVAGNIKDLISPFLATHTATLHEVSTGILVLAPR